MKYVSVAVLYIWVVLTKLPFLVKKKHERCTSAYLYQSQWLLEDEQRWAEMHYVLIE